MTAEDCSHSTVKAVLFDLDGTLLDSAADFAVIITELCQKYGWQVPSQQSLHQKVSSGARAMLTLASGIPDSSAEFGTYLDEFLERYFEQIQNPASALYPGVKSLLDSLDQQQTPWGIVTNKPLRYSEPLLASLGISKQCATLVCPDHVKARKPSPEPLLLAAKQLNLEPEKCTYVGDHQRDIQAGHAAGMPTIAAAYGYLPAPDDEDELNVEDWNADYIAGDVAELHTLLTRLLAR